MSEEKTCPNCGAAMMPGDVFCGECGARVQAPAYDVAPATLPDDVSPQAVEEPPAEEPSLETEPAAGEYIPPPPVRQETNGSNAWRIVAIVAAVVFLLLSLCFCSFGGLVLIPTQEVTTAQEDKIYAALCFAPGVISGLLGIGAAYFSFKKR